MKRILNYIFLLSFLTSCEVRTLQTPITADNIEKKSKANVTFSGELKEVICINCSQ